MNSPQATLQRENARIGDRGPRSAAGCLLLAGLILVASGCARRADVSGVVTLDGKPLSSGVVTFTPAAGGPTAYAAIGEDGTYRVQTGAAAGLPAGAYVVTVAANTPPTSDSQPGPGPLADGIRPLVTPQRYADPGQSPLRITLASGTQTLPLVLTSE
jgi:hypothetical protein